ncbi:MAG: putative monooxygenase, PheA/TfdB family [Amycolatopsis sp.]|jgi:phenol 2-monooxygenase|uniref:hypothetical protein n=1 Tax=Amycolatopsis sp. TaxID=37632 RepID=UPI0026291DE9|nr:hypothetical protein [Amycolatopsis sp.]MCU1686857.1 putative monooxygenase, PheA/TfdB family [Amycolatopsis sp.]
MSSWVYAADLDEDISDLRGINRNGAVVVLWPDQYVVNGLPLGAPAELAAFFEPILSVQRQDAGRGCSDRSASAQ